MSHKCQLVLIYKGNKKKALLAIIQYIVTYVVSPHWTGFITIATSDEKYIPSGTVFWKLCGN